MSDTVDPVEIPGHVMRFWHAMDALFERVRSTWWGAIVTDSRFPAIWDANYARVDAATNRLGADEVDGELLPALSAVGARIHHVVMFQPGLTARLLEELEERGLSIGRDLVMELGRDPISLGEAHVEEVTPGEELWDRVGASLSLFGARSSQALSQLVRIEREVMTPGGKRWFGVRDASGTLRSIGALLMLDGVAYVDNVATFPEARRRGLASAVTSAIAREARSTGAQSTWLLSDPDEPGIVRMYERLGFVRVGEIASTRGPIPIAAGPSGHSSG